MAPSIAAARLMVVALLASVASTHTIPRERSLTTRDAPVVVGCFSSSEPLSDQGTYKYQSSGHCSGICTSRNQGVVGLSDGDTCWCGDELPAENTKVLDSKCSTPCQGYGVVTCGGGIYYFTVWLTGLDENVQNYDPGNTSSTLTATEASATSTPSPTPPKDDHQTKTSPSTTASANESREKSDKRIAIILGVVLGAIAIAVLGLVIWWVRRRRKYSGSFFRGRSTPLLVNGSRPDSSASSIPEATIYVSAGSKTWQGRISRTPVASARLSKPIDQASEFPHQDEDPSTDGNPFYAPEERVSASDWNYAEPARNQHPPLLMPGVAMKVQDSHANHHMNHHMSHHASSPQFHDPNTYQQLVGTSNPFDDEAVDVISPLDPPLKKLDRIRSMPMVHYPSWSEVSDFDFSGTAETKYERRSVDGWHLWRERQDGRHELA